jgi:hypothetical protein
MSHGRRWNLVENSYDQSCKLIHQNGIHLGRGTFFGYVNGGGAKAAPPICIVSPERIRILSCCFHQWVGNHKQFFSVVSTIETFQAMPTKILDGGSHSHPGCEWDVIIRICDIAKFPTGTNIFEVQQHNET